MPPGISRGHRSCPSPPPAGPVRSTGAPGERHRPRQRQNPAESPAETLPSTVPESSRVSSRDIALDSARTQQSLQRRETTRESMPEILPYCCCCCYHRFNSTGGPLYSCTHRRYCTVVHIYSTRRKYSAPWSPLSFSCDIS